MKKSINEWAEKEDIYSKVPTNPTNAKKYYGEQAQRFITQTPPTWKDVDPVEVRNQLVSHKSAHKKGTKRKASQSVDEVESAGDQEDGTEEETGDDHTVEEKRGDGYTEEERSDDHTVDDRDVPAAESVDPAEEVDTTQLPVTDERGEKTAAPAEGSEKRAPKKPAAAAVAAATSPKQKKSKMTVEASGKSRQKAVSFRDVQGWEEIIDQVHGLVGSKPEEVESDLRWAAVRVLASQTWSGDNLLAAKVCFFSSSSSS